MSLLSNWNNGDLISVIRNTTNTAINTIGKLLVSATDTSFGYLLDKLVAGTGITITQNNAGGNETITIDGPDISGKLNSSSIIIASSSAVGPTSYSAEATVLTVTPSASKSSAKMKFTFMGYLINGASSSGSSIRIKRNGTEIAITRTAPDTSAQQNFCLVWISTYTAGDIITATVQSASTESINEYILICECFDAA
jgi:hypothetical protein